MAMARSRRWGLGPVFVYEWLTGSRRWQMYALRALFVAMLLVCLAMVWVPFEGQVLTIGLTASISEIFFRRLGLLQLLLVMLAAPAVMAGSICVEKSRGTLLHLLVTDLSDDEIVLGKLAARLTPVLMVLASGVPVLALTGLLGGIDPGALLGSFLVTVGTASVGCTLALMLSIWLRRAYQALLLTYLVEGLLLAGPAPLEWLITPAATWWTGISFPADGLARRVNPFRLVNPPVTTSGLGLAECGIYFAVAVGASAWLLAVSVRRMRRVVTAQAFRPAKREKPGGAAGVLRWLPGPSLDGNPVLWREWHRKRPGKWAGRFWTAYAAASGLASLGVIAASYMAPWSREWGWSRDWGRELAPMVNAWQAAIGLLLLSASAPMALAEERDQGSMDVIMATPLATREIIWGKWWGTFALVPRLLIFPTWVVVGLAMVSENWLAPLLMLGLIVAYAAAITSLGMALATWVPRLGRAVAWSVTLYALAAIGPVAVAISLTFQALVSSPTAEVFLPASPYFGVLATTEMAGRMPFQPGRDLRFLSVYIPFWIGALAVFSLVLMRATLATFDRRMGRVAEIPESWHLRPLPRPEGWSQETTVVSEWTSTDAR